MSASRRSGLPESRRAGTSGRRLTLFLQRSLTLLCPRLEEEDEAALEVRERVAGETILVLRVSDQETVGATTVVHQELLLPREVAETWGLLVVEGQTRNPSARPALGQSQAATSEGKANPCPGGAMTPGIETLRRAPGTARTRTAELRKFRRRLMSVSVSGTCLRPGGLMH